MVAINRDGDGDGDGDGTIDGGWWVESHHE